ncbi:hypothetical protein LLH03_21040 [bacterium]|nr:hypothetical protein [bacterium]
MASKHDVEGWTYFTWDVDESLRGIASASGVLDAGGRKVRLPDLKQAQGMHLGIVRRAGLVKLKETPWVVTYGREAS